MITFNQRQEINRQILVALASANEAMGERMNEHKDKINAARAYYGGVWPPELYSGVMFHDGVRITRDDFLGL